MGNYYVELHVTVRTQSDQAVCVIPDGSNDEFWIPMSIVGDTDLDAFCGGESKYPEHGFVEVPRWFCQKEGLL